MTTENKQNEGSTKTTEVKTTLNAEARQLEHKQEKNTFLPCGTYRTYCIERYRPYDTVRYKRSLCSLLYCTVLDKFTVLRQQF